MRRYLALFVLSLLAGCGAPAKKRAPGREALSPLGAYLVRAETPKARETNREIVITRPGQKLEILRFPYSRQVDVVWAPDETALAIIDLAAPNENRVLIFALPSGTQLFEARREDTCRLEPRLPCGDAYQRVFFRELIWLAPNQIRLGVEMYGPSFGDLPPEVHGELIATFGVTFRESR